MLYFGKRLLLRLSRKELRFANDTSHCISKSIVKKAQDTQRNCPRILTFTFLNLWNGFLWPLISIEAGNTDNQAITLKLIILQRRVWRAVKIPEGG
jgi:hypothetical protein